MRASLLLLLGACSGPSDDAGGVVVDAPDTVEMNDIDGGLEVTISGGSAPGYRFGGVWLDVDLTAEGCLEDADMCHTLGADGGFFDVVECEAATDGTSCIPLDGYRLGHMTFVLLPSIGSGCWTWGTDVSYYDALGCDVTDWSNDSY